MKMKWKGLKIILGRERAGIINYWYLDDRGEREGRLLITES